MTSKEEHAAYMRKWRKKNPDKVRQSNIRYRRKNKYQIKEYMDNYRITHLKEYAEASSTYYYKNRKKVNRKNLANFHQRKLKEQQIKRNQIFLLYKVYGYEYLKKEGLL